MREVYGIGDFRYEYVEGWGKLPAGITFHECPGVAVDAHDNVYILTRGEHPVMVFDRDGTFLSTWGEGVPSAAVPAATSKRPIHPCPHTRKPKGCLRPKMIMQGLEKRKSHRSAAGDHRNS